VILAAAIVSGTGAAPALAGSDPFRADLQAEYGIAVDGPTSLVVVNNAGVFRTVDGGAQWTNITPVSLRHLVDHVAKVIAIGPDIWLEMEGDERFGFLRCSRDGGRTWRTTRIAGAVQMSGLVFENQRDGWVTVTTAKYQRARYRTTDGGRTWHRSGELPTIAVPRTVSGTRITTHGLAPAGLTVRYAIRFPGGLSWALASGPDLGSYFPTYLLRSTNGGRTWTTVPRR
jgi:BNR/Asp-box repeat